METGRLAFAGDVGVAWILGPRRRFFSWFVFVTITTPTGTSTRFWTFWTRRGALARIGRYVSDSIAFSEAVGEGEGDDVEPTEIDPMNRG